MQSRLEEILRKVARGEPLTARWRAELLARRTAWRPAESYQALRYHETDLRGVCDFALKIDADRDELVAQITSIAAGGRVPHENERALFLSRVAMSARAER